MPTFVSTVEIEGVRFQGQEAKTKKQAETNAAKVAYINLTEGRASRNSTDVSPGYQVTGASELSSSNLQSSMTNEVQSNLIQNTNEKQLSIRLKANLSTENVQVDTNIGRARENHTALSSGALEVSSSRLQALVTHKSQPNVTTNITDEMQQNGRSKNLLIEEQAGKELDTSVKRHRCSPSDDVSSFPSGSTTTCQKILVRPQKPNMAYTDGVIVASDGKWVAMRVDVDQVDN